MSTTLFIPGHEVEHSPEETAGEGIDVRDGRWIAVHTGRIEREAGVVRVRSSVGEPLIPQVGDRVFASVRALYDQIAEVKVISVEGKPNRTITPPYDVGELHVSEIVGRFLSEPRDAFSRRDIIRAEVLHVSPMVKLTTKGKPELGVLYGICPVCGTQLEAELHGDWNVHCPECDHRSFRSLSDGFGHGHVLPEEGRSNELNQEGSSWSKEVEEMRLKDRMARGALRDRENVVNCTLCGALTTVPFRPQGDKPVRCSSCMQKVKSGKASKDELVAEQKKLKDGGGGRGGRGGGRGDRPPGHAVTCTMCGKDTTVPFQPTAGRPVRCSDCFGRVQDGTATREKFAKEREVLAAQGGGGGRRRDGGRGGHGGGGGRAGGRGGRGGGGGRDGGRGGHGGGGGRDGGRGGHGGGGGRDGGRGGRGGGGGRDGRGRRDGGGRGGDRGSGDMDADREAAARREEGLE